MATNYIWNSVTDNVLVEVDDAGGVQATYTQEPSLYGSVVSQKRNGVTSYYHFDGQGSTRQLTDSDQDVTDTATYSAFGEVVEKTGATVNPWGYKGDLGYHADESTPNVLYVRTRHLAVNLARWLSVDVLGFEDGNNRFAYVHNDPVNGRDPSGQLTCRLWYPHDDLKSCLNACDTRYRCCLRRSHIICVIAFWDPIEARPRKGQLRCLLVYKAACLEDYRRCKDTYCPEKYLPEAPTTTPCKPPEPYIPAPVRESATEYLIEECRKYCYDLIAVVDGVSPSDQPRFDQLMKKCMKECEANPSHFFPVRRAR